MPRRQEAPAIWPKRKSLTAVLDEHPGLNASGFPTLMARTGPIQPDEFIAAQAWFLTFATPTAALWTHHSSYGIKHKAEAWGFGYIANGAAIAAAYSLGIAVQQEWPNSPNGFMRATFRSTPRPLPQLFELDQGAPADDVAIAVAATHALAGAAGVDAWALWSALGKPSRHKPARKAAKSNPWGPRTPRMPLLEAVGAALRSEVRRR